MNYDRFNQGDFVKYTGTKLPEVSKKLGQIISTVAGEENAFVVNFGSSDYICHVANLSRQYIKEKTEDIDPEIERIVRKLESSSLEK